MNAVQEGNFQGPLLFSPGEIHLVAQRCQQAQGRPS